MDLAVNLTPERREEVREELFPEGPALRSYLYRFAVLQSLAVFEAVDEWTRGTGLQSTGVSVEDERITVNVAGPKEPPSADPPAADLAERLNSPVAVEVRWAERQETIAEGQPQGG